MEIRVEPSLMIEVCGRQRAFLTCHIVRTFRSAVSGEPKGSHYMVVKNALVQRDERQPVVGVHRDHQLIRAGVVAHRRGVRDVLGDELRRAGPGRMRETPPFCTLLTYFVPSGMITRPSLPACTAFSVFTSWPSGENVSTSLLPMLMTTMLPCGSKAMPFG